MAIEWPLFVQGVENEWNPPFIFLNRIETRNLGLIFGYIYIQSFSTSVGVTCIFFNIRERPVEDSIAIYVI